MATDLTEMTRAPSGPDEAAAMGGKATHAREPEPHVLLLWGPPGVGKTTVVRRLARALEGKRLSGFYTEEIRERGARQGFRLVGFAGSERVIAHVGLPKRHRVGKYGVDVAAVDEAASLLAPDAFTDIVLVDEIGRMECLSARFVAALRALLAATTPVVATVALRGVGFIAEVKGSKACVLWEVTHGNRDALPARIAAWLRT
ncbi:MAG: nucleoside-triphosphatase [Alphaproteobacteria bacterium]